MTPVDWSATYYFNANAKVVNEPRVICPHCRNASTFRVLNVEQERVANRDSIYMLLRCNYTKCKQVVFIHTSVLAGHQSNQLNDPFHVYPSRFVQVPHPSIPVNIADDWLEAQKAMQAEAPKAAAVMFRRVLYSILIDKGCKLHPIKDGTAELITKARLPAIFDDWLPAIKDDGHDGAHPDRALQVSSENVAETMEYTAELLRFLYIEPYEFQERKKRNATSA